MVRSANGIFLSMRAAPSKRIVRPPVQQAEVEAFQDDKFVRGSGEAHGNARLWLKIARPKSPTLTPTLFSLMRRRCISRALVGVVTVLSQRRPLENGDPLPPPPPLNFRDRSYPGSAPCSRHAPPGRKTKS